MGDNDADDEKTMPALNKMSSALVLNDRNVRLSEMDAFNVKIEALLLNLEELSKKQEQTEETVQAMKEVIQELDGGSNASMFKSFVNVSIAVSTLLFAAAWYQRSNNSKKK